MKKLFYLLISIWFCLGSTVLAQNPEWITYNTFNSGLPGNSVECIKMDHLGNMWIGSFGEMNSSGSSLVKYDGTNWTVYNLSNWILCLAIDELNNKWIGTYEGLVKFDGTNWTNYNTTNSDLPDNTINCIGIDKFDNKWIGIEEGLAKFDGINWTVYNTANSDLPNNNVLCIATDDFNNKWTGYYSPNDNLVKYDDTSWTLYSIPNPYGNPPPWIGPVPRITIDSTGNKWIASWVAEPFSWSGLIKYDDTTFTFYEPWSDSLTWWNISCIEIDNLGNKWIGGKGLAKFDDSNWTFYNTANSGLLSDFIKCIEVDEQGNKWIGSDSGLTVFNEGGIVPVELNAFTAKANGKEVTLNWSTATEINNQGFEVQRKFGNNDFATIGSVKGHGTTTSPNQYSFVDILVDGGKYFYRLKQIDFNGTFEYSNVIEVDVRLLDKFTLEQNYPNPFNPTTTISWQSPVGSWQTLKVYYLLGNEIATLVNEYKPAGTYEIIWNAANLPSGVYFYHLQATPSGGQAGSPSTGSGQGFVETKKMILMK